ncbi:MAG: TIGR00730 family Rossman fold protein [bacterium]|nr:TIGR00730 family Rossman fold protein [bacterium]
MKRLCIYCGSNPGKRPEYIETAQTLGQTLAQRGVGVVYGGAKVGTMGAIADAALAAGGEVIGVIPHGLVALEVAHTGLTELHRVETLHERKAKMLELCDGLICLPGGHGTLDEMFEAITWLQLGIHSKPIGLLNVAGFYDSLVGHLDHCAGEGFIRPEHRSMLLVDPTIDGLLQRFADFEPPDRPEWLARIDPG